MINVMTYDLYGAWHNKIGHHSALYHRPDETGMERELNTVPIFYFLRIIVLNWSHCRIHRCIIGSRPVVQENDSILVYQAMAEHFQQMEEIHSKPTDKVAAVLEVFHRLISVRVGYWLILK